MSPQDILGNGSAIVITSDRCVQQIGFAPPASYAEVNRLLAQVVGQGWILHQLDDEICASSLMKPDAVRRNTHAEAIVKSIGVLTVPLLYGPVVLTGLVNDKEPPPWRRLTSLDDFYQELITQEHHNLREAD